MSIAIVAPVVFVGIIAGFVAFYHITRFLDAKATYKKLVDLYDCPFKFSIKSGEYTDHVAFNLGEVELYCDYKFGIRRDGIYGINKLTLRGFNNTEGSNIRLKIGESIFPIIAKMKQFEEWYETKIFATSWESGFMYKWEKILNSIDNLSYLETKSKENEGK